MKVILKQDVKALGKKEQIVEVSDGYANNFLIKKGWAVIADSVNVNVLHTKQAANARKQQQEKEQMMSLADVLNKRIVVIKVKVGANGKPFGAITSKDISEALKKQHNLDIDRKKIHLSEPIKMLCSQYVDIKLHHEINAKLMVKVEQESV